MDREQACHPTTVLARCPDETGQVLNALDSETRLCSGSLVSQCLPPRRLEIWRTYRRHRGAERLHN